MILRLLPPHERFFSSLVFATVAHSAPFAWQKGGTDVLKRKGVKGEAGGLSDESRLSKRTRRFPLLVFDTVDALLSIRFGNVEPRRDIPQLPWNSRAFGNSTFQLSTAFRTREVRV